MEDLALKDFERLQQISTGAKSLCFLASFAKYEPGLTNCPAKPAQSWVHRFHD